MIQQMLAIWSLVPLPFLNPWTSGSSNFTYCWSLAWRTLFLILCLNLFYFFFLSFIRKVNRIGMHLCHRFMTLGCSRCSLVKNNFGSSLNMRAIFFSCWLRVSQQNSFFLSLQCPDLKSLLLYETGFDVQPRTQTSRITFWEALTSSSITLACLPAFWATFSHILCP